MGIMTKDTKVAEKVIGISPSWWREVCARRVKVPPKNNRNRAEDLNWILRKKNPPKYGSEMHPTYIPSGEGE